MPYYVNAEGKRERLKLSLSLIMHFIRLLNKANPNKWFMPTETQQKFLELTMPYQILVAGSRYGKSMWTAIKVAAYMWFAPQITGIPLKCWCVGPEYQLGEKEFHWVLEIFQDLEDSLKIKMFGKKPNDSRQFMFIQLTNGSTLQVITVGNKHQRNVLGDEVDFIIFSESAQQKEFQWLFEGMCVRALINREGYAIFPSTPHGFGFFKQLHERGKSLSPQWHEYITLGPYTNYQGGGVTLEKFMNAYYTLSEEAFCEQWCGMFVMMSGHVYKEFRHQKHTLAKVPVGIRLNKTTPLYCGIDWGFRNPFAMTFAVRDGDGRYYFFDEIYEKELTNDQKADKALQKLRGWTNVNIYVDSEDPEARAVFANRGIPTILADKDVRSGILTVKDYMKVQADGKPRVFYVTQPGKSKDVEYGGVPNMVEEKLSYRWKDKTDEKNEFEEPLKLNDHLMDSERYLINTVHNAEKAEQFITAQMSGDWSFTSEDFIDTNKVAEKHKKKNYVVY